VARLVYAVRTQGKECTERGQDYSWERYRQRIVQIDHGVNSAAGKVRCLHLKNPQKVTLKVTFLGEFGVPKTQKS
jgi:hypothetical protein